MSSEQPAENAVVEEPEELAETPAEGGEQAGDEGEGGEQREEPVVDPRDAIIESLLEQHSKLLERETPAARRDERGADEPEVSEEDELRALGFGNVGSDPETGKGGVNMIPNLLKALRQREARLFDKIQGAVAPQLDRLGRNLVSSTFDRELAVRVQKQTPEFLAFRDAELARDGDLRSLRSTEKGAVVAAELVESRWRKTRQAIKQGEERREGRRAGASLHNDSPRGGNSLGRKTLEIWRNAPDRAQQYIDWVDAGNSPESITMTRHDPKLKRR